MKRFIIKYLWIFVLLIAVAFLILYTLDLPDVNIDSNSIIFIIIIIISPLISQIRKIKFGNFEAEIESKEVKKVVEEIEEKISTSTEEKADAIGKKGISSIRDILEADHVLALAKLRMELEKIANSLFSINDLNNKSDGNRFVPLNKKIYEMTIKEIIPKNTSNMLNEIIYFCNRAIHGEEVKNNDARMIVNSGIRIYYEISSILKEYISTSIETVTIEQDVVDGFLEAQYRMETIIPYVNNPVKNIRIITQTELDNFFDGYNEFGEFIVKLGKQQQ